MKQQTDFGEIGYLLWKIFSSASLYVIVQFEHWFWKFPNEQMALLVGEMVAEGLSIIYE